MGIDTKRGECANALHRMAEVAYTVRQQARSAVGEVDGEEVAATGNAQAAVAWLWRLAPLKRYVTV
jgi:hypothetical protein